MPAPGQMAPHRDNAHFAKMLEALQSKGEPDLAREVAELRKEIAALRAELAPVPSLIVTGRQALDEFKRLTPNVRVQGCEPAPSAKRPLERRVGGAVPPAPTFGGSET